MSLLEGILKDYFCRRPDVQLLQKHVNEQMSAFEDQEEAKRNQLAKASKTADEEGFITVVSKATTATTTAATTSGQPKGRLQQDGKELPFEIPKNFYKFQTRRKKVDELQELKRKFEADKLRLEQLRKDRLFKS